MHPADGLHLAGPSMPDGQNVLIPLENVRCFKGGLGALDTSARELPLPLGPLHALPTCLARRVARAMVDLHHGIVGVAPPSSSHIRLSAWRACPLVSGSTHRRLCCSVCCGFCSRLVIQAFVNPIRGPIDFCCSVVVPGLLLGSRAPLPWQVPKH